LSYSKGASFKQDGLKFGTENMGIRRRDIWYAQVGQAVTLCQYNFGDKHGLKACHKPSHFPK